jgi:hypothetical protein
MNTAEQNVKAAREALIQYDKETHAGELAIVRQQQAFENAQKGPRVIANEMCEEQKDYLKSRVDGRVKLSDKHRAAMLALGKAKRSILA